MPLTRPALAALLIALSLGALAPSASAQWAWRDANGTVVFSDRAPPPSVKASQIVRQPGVSATPVIPGEAVAAEPAAARAAAPAAPSAAQRELEARKRQQDAQASAAKVADDEATRARRAQECERARSYLRALEEGQRVARPTADGGREFLDDAQRAEELQRMRQNVTSLCQP
ncbi:MAG: hypothetical protein RI936_599 [Pseudomonadota bacterium]